MYYLAKPWQLVFIESHASLTFRDQNRTEQKLEAEGNSRELTLKLFNFRISFDFTEWQSYCVRCFVLMLR